jgi:flagellar biosynthesis protein FlhA
MGLCRERRHEKRRRAPGGRELMIGTLRKIVGDNADLALIALVVGILTILFVPVPSQLLDLLLIANLSFALLVLLITFYTLKPVEFSTFPSLLLIATLFRLSLNIAATRLILSQAAAGKVIAAVGSYVVAGNYVTGLIVFLILVVVQYVVITNGAQRVAEVAARFTLDSMPGQQMAIDADLNMGFIDQKQAQQRRKLLEREANFYGAMDGASKFVKGDAIAGILILLINIIGGLAIGVFQLGMPWRDAVQTYTLLTIGDGIVTQIPALVISIGTGIIITRSASDAQLSAELSNQFTNYPKTLFLVLALLAVLLVLPGIPIWPILVLSPIVGGMGWVALRKKAAVEAVEDAAETAAAKGGDDELYGSLAVEPLEVRVGQNLVALIGNDGAALMDRIVMFRKQYAQESGVIAPKVRVRDEKRLRPNGYEVFMYGTAIGGGELLADRTLAIHGAAGERRKLQGLETLDPTYGLPAFWIADVERQTARAAGYTLVDPMTVLVTHISELLKRNVAALLTRAETERLVERLRPQQAGLLDELIPNIMTLGEVQKVLQNLLREKVSIRNLGAILEVLADAGRNNKNAEHLTELVRQRLGTAICQSLADSSGSVYVLTLDPAIEHTITASLRATDEKTSLALEPRFAEQVLSRIGAQVERMVKNNAMPVLLCSPDLRRHLRRLTERVLPHLAVLSMTEVPNNVSLKSFGVVTI